MGETSPNPLTPTEQHKKLLEKVGDWRVECLYFTNPEGEPITAEGVDHVEAIGSFWTTGTFSCNLVGNPIQGLATTGYDPRKKKFISTWQDSSTPFFYYFEGGFADDGALVMEGENADPMTSKLVTYKSIENLGLNERKLRLFIEIPDAEPLKILEYRYTRI